jgi:hypothetical protein
LLYKGVSASGRRFVARYHFPDREGPAYQHFGTFDTQEQAAQAIAAEVGYAAGGGLHLRVQPVEDPGFRGVTMRSNAFHGEMWMSHIHANGSQLALGSFDTKEEAAAAFDGAVRFRFKEEAKCNFDMEMEDDAVSADEASREAKQTRQLIHEGRIALIKKRAIAFGLRKGYSEADAL